MKSVTMQVAREDLNRFFAELSPGDLIVMTDGDRRFVVEACDSDEFKRESWDLEEDSPELGEELIKGLTGPFSPYTRSNLEAVADKVHREKQANELNDR